MNLHPHIGGKKRSEGKNFQASMSTSYHIFQKIPRIKQQKFFCSGHNNVISSRYTPRLVTQQDGENKDNITCLWLHLCNYPGRPSSINSMCANTISWITLQVTSKLSAFLAAFCSEE